MPERDKCEQNEKCKPKKRDDQVDDAMDDEAGADVVDITDEDACSSW